MEGISIDIYNLYENVNFEYCEDTKSLRVSWDRKNKELHELMKKERIPYTMNYKYNAFWVGELKKNVGWVEGVKMKISIKDIAISACNEFTIQVLDDNHVGYICESIDEDGYLCTLQYGTKLIGVNKYIESMKRCDCLYNEMIQEEHEPYILK
jgi:hypothetical protein